LDDMLSLDVLLWYVSNYIGCSLKWHSRDVYMYAKEGADGV